MKKISIFLILLAVFLGSVFLYISDVKKTRRLMDNGRTVWKTNAEKELFEKAETLFKNREFNLARSQYKNFIEKYPNSDAASEAQYQIVLTYSRNQDADNAILESKKLLKQYPKSREVRITELNLPGYYASKKDFKTAIKLTKRLKWKYLTDDKTRPDLESELKRYQRSLEFEKKKKSAEIK